MTRDRLINGAILVALLALGIWIARHTYWTQVTVTTPPQGEAATNPFYSVERVLHAVGIRTRKVSALRFLPPPAEAIYVAYPHLEAVHSPLAQLQRWVESGGRLVITGNAIWGLPSLQKWSGISPHLEAQPGSPPMRLAAGDTAAPCPSMTVRLRGVANGASLKVCGITTQFGFVSRRVPDWSLENPAGLQWLRVAVGRGSLIVVDAQVTAADAFLRDDDAQAFIDAAQLHRGERLNLFDPQGAEGFPHLLWRLGAPAVVCFGVALALFILGHLTRFGPLIPAPALARRSLADQIRANARLAARTGKLGTLRAAVSRALERSAIDHIAGYRSLNVRQRAEALAARAGLDSAAMVQALTGDAADAGAAHSAIHLLEHARRALEPSPIPSGTTHDR